MIHYILQTIAFQLFFLLAYDVFLKHDTFFKWNRMYLLATAILSLILPFIKVESFKKIVPQNYIISLPEIVLGQSSANPNNTIALNAVVLEQNSMSIWELIFYIGLCIAFCLFLYKVFKILALVIKNPKQSVGNIVLVELLNSNAAFSFFHYIFLGERIKAEDKEAILKHELIHTKQKHTLDLLFFEVLRIVFWFNPFVYMYQNRMATLHEFIADANAVKHQNKGAYYQNLLAQVFETKNISFINTFFKQSLIKKRIVMLSKTKSKQVNLLKYALLIPMVLGMLVYTSCNSEENLTEKKQQSLIEQINELKLVIETKEELTKEERQSLLELYLKSKMRINGVENIRSEIKKDYSNESEVPFSVIENVPIYPGCEELISNVEKKKCMSQRIFELVAKNFNTKIGKELGLKGRQRINVIFKIDEEGNIIDVRSRAPHPDLEKEAKRVINALPKMIPGKQDGKAVTVPYSLPIIFQVAD